MANNKLEAPSVMWRRQNKILFDREIGIRSGFSSNSIGFEKEMLISQTFGNNGESNYYQKDILGHFGCVNAVEFSPKPEEFLASGGDDKRVLVWKTSELFNMVGRPKPIVMKRRHESNIFCLAFTSDMERLLSSGNDHTVLVHNLAYGDPVDVYILDEAVYSINVHPDTDRIFLTACEDGLVQLWDMRLPPTADAVVIASHHAAFQCATFNPIEGRLIATANSRDGVQLWDVRKPKLSVMRYDVGYNQNPIGSFIRERHASCMCVRWDSRGERVLALRRRMSPVLFHIRNPNPIAYFENTGYFNSCTMKSCCFAGMEDEYVISGSDNFSIYVWQTPPADSDRFYEHDPEKKPIMVDKASWELKGHRSIVNQVRYSKSHQVLVSSGVEKIVKLWSPWPMPGSRDGGTTRRLYSQQEYLNMVFQVGGLAAAQDEEEARGATDEDPRMLAFFDSLVRRELQSAESSDDSSDDEIELRLLRGIADDSENSESTTDIEETLFQRIRRQRQRRRLQQRNEDRSGAYSNVVVDSESTSSSDSLTLLSDLTTDTSDTLTTRSSESLSSSDDEGKPNEPELETLSEPENQRWSLRRNESENGASTSGLSTQSGHPQASSSCNAVTNTLGLGRFKQRKRTCADATNARTGGKRRRVLSDSDLTTVDDNNVQQRRQELSLEEVERRVVAAMAECRRRRSAQAFRRLLRIMTASDDTNSGVDRDEQPRPTWYFTSSSSESESEDHQSTSTKKKFMAKNTAVLSSDHSHDGTEPQTSGEPFKKKKADGEASTSNTVSPPKRQYRKRKPDSSSESSDVDD